MASRRPPGHRLWSRDASTIGRCGVVPPLSTLAMHRTTVPSTWVAARGGTRCGTQVADGETRHTGWSAERMREDVRAIADEMHASSISVVGVGVDRLAATASEAAERGLHVWLQPRLADAPRREILDHLAETGEHAERLRRSGAAVHLSVGCEFALLVPGIVPGDDAVERVANLIAGRYDPVRRGAGRRGRLGPVRHRQRQLLLVVRAPGIVRAGAREVPALAQARVRLRVRLVHLPRRAGARRSGLGRRRRRTRSSPPTCPTGPAPPSTSTPPATAS